VTINTSMPALDQILGLRTVNLLTRVAHPAQSRVPPMASAELSRRVEKVRRLPAALRARGSSAARVHEVLRDAGSRRGQG
jgi:hypothetical protein